MNAHQKVQAVMWSLIVISALCIMTSGFFIWQVILAFQMGSAYGITTNIVIIFVLVLAGALGIFAAVRQSKYCMNTFTVFSIVIIVMSLFEIIITAIGASKCDNLDSTSSDTIWNFICAYSAPLLIVPLAVLSVLLIVGIILRCILGKFLEEEEFGPGGEMDNYYPS